MAGPISVALNGQEFLLPEQSHTEVHRPKNKTSKMGKNNFKKLIHLEVKIQKEQTAQTTHQQNK